MSENLRPIIMRSNRLLGAALVDRNFITVDQLNQATERFLQMLETAPATEASLLSVVVHELKAISEETLLEHLVDELQLGVIDPRELDLNDDLKLHINTGVCWATWTVPFDKDEDVHYVASAYYLSQAVRQHWEKLLGGPVIWFGATLESINEFLEKLTAERAAHSSGSQVHAGAA